MASVPYTSNIITEAAKRLKTAFANNLWVPLMPRLRRLCGAWLADYLSQRQAAKQQRLLGPVRQYEQQLLDQVWKDPSALQLLRAIETGSVASIPTTAAAFVADVRHQLGLGAAADAQLRQEGCAPVPCVWGAPPACASGQNRTAAPLALHGACTRLIILIWSSTNNNDF